MSATPDDSQVLDLEHLSRQTAGDRALERELLTIFETQCVRLRLLIGGGNSLVQRADAAHKLKGSARAIGAWRLASLADRLETDLRNGDAETAVACLMAMFDETIEATRRVLADRDRASAA